MFQEDINDLVVISNSRWSLVFYLSGWDAFLFQEGKAQPGDVGDDR
jgi:hypothetical protein